MPTLPLTLACPCGLRSQAQVAAGQVWTCACGLAWRPDPETVIPLLGAVEKFANLRRVVAATILAALLAAAALAFVHPQWILGGPLLVGAAATLLRPTWRKRRAELRRLARVPIGLVAA